jgi:hypothetical protein
MVIQMYVVVYKTYYYVCRRNLYSVQFPAFVILTASRTNKNPCTNPNEKCLFQVGDILNIYSVGGFPGCSYKLTSIRFTPHLLYKGIVHSSMSV